MRCGGSFTLKLSKILNQIEFEQCGLSFFVLNNNHKKMPRAAKPKAAPAKKAKGKLYAMPERLKEGTILTDLAKGQWRIGPSIGIGGFGEIYAACRNGEKNYDAVVKCEPHGNGPLFVEMHFYLRNAKLDDIKQFKQQHGLKSLGMPYILANGSADVNGQKHRFIVMPRYGSDVSKFFLQNGKSLPEATAYRLAIQMLEVYQFMHSTGYVHADLKAANILLGLGKGGAAQAYLVDFGLASHYITGDFKPDPKKMHNGTIEYTSRDAHLGVATRRADLEILGYNLIEWLGVELPWVKEKLLTVPLKVQKAKEAFMSDINASLKALFPKGVPAPISDYMKYVAKLGHNDEPDYGKCRSFFLNALKQMKVANSGDLDFKLKPQSSNNNNSPPVKSPVKVPAVRGRAKKDASLVISSSSEDVIIDSDEEEDESYTPHRKLATSKETSVGPKGKKVTPTRKAASNLASASPKKREAPKSNSPQRASHQKRSKIELNATPNGPSSSAKINFSPALSLRGRAGKTVINDELTPQLRSKKTYEFNFELDVSMDANVIVNVKRKKKAKANEESSTKTATGASRTPSARSVQTPTGSSPATRVNLRKMNCENGASSPALASARSPCTPTVTVRKYRR